MIEMYFHILKFQLETVMFSLNSVILIFFLCQAKVLIVETREQKSLQHM